MQRFKKKIKRIGFDWNTFRSNVFGYRWYREDYKEITNKNQGVDFFGPIIKKPIYHDKWAHSGVMSGHYFHQDLYVAQKIFENRPVKHVDVGSRIDGFVAHVASYREIEVFDIRKPTDETIRNITFVQADFSKQDSLLNNYTDSISCLHTIEHFGLGRYNDSIDINGHLKGFESIFRVLKSGGIFYFSTPIGPQRIEFNAHRVFSMEYLLAYFSDKYDLLDFSYVNDKGNLVTNPVMDQESLNCNFGCKFGCGIFILKKR